MSLVQIQNIKKEIVDRTFFEIDNLTIDKGNRIGLVGNNGSGKTTLLNILTGNLEPDQGYIERNTSINLLPQLKKTETTKSGGEVTAEYVIEALNKAPEVLLADEPTTHLDKNHIVWVEKEFQRFKGSYVVISHDRSFLDNVCDTIWELKDGKIEVYSGNYTFYKEQKEKAFNRQKSEYDEYIKKSKKLEEVRKKKMEHADSIESESKSFYHRKIAKKLNKNAKSIEKRIERLEEVDKPEEIEPIKMKLPDSDLIRNRFVVRGFDVEGTVPNKLLWKQADFSIKGGDKVALLGDNGSGKTTLLKKILDKDEKLTISPALKVGYFAQNLSLLNVKKTILENVSEEASQPETIIRTVLASLGFKRESVNKPVSVLSGGERVKVSLAKLLVGEYNALILDEPTNFLDIQAVEALERLLKEYEGTLLLVSHDRRFLSEIVNRFLIIENQQLNKFEGSYDDWVSSQEHDSATSEKEEELLRVENEITTVLGRLSLDPMNKELDTQFNDLVKKKRQLQE